jgi:hypothetical protein
MGNAGCAEARGGGASRMYAAQAKTRHPNVAAIFRNLLFISANLKSILPRRFSAAGGAMVPPKTKKENGKNFRHSQTIRRELLECGGSATAFRSSRITHDPARSAATMRTPSHHLRSSAKRRHNSHAAAHFSGVAGQFSA